MKTRIAAAVGSVALLALTACSTDNSATTADQHSTNSQLSRYQKNQPVPAFDWSQYRQTVIDVESAEVHGVATTTFFYNMGSEKPIASCPSIGFPVASTAQLTNPDQAVWHSSNGSAVISQQEPNGVYTGNSSGTYVVCVLPNGSKQIDYWEGSVYTAGGTAHIGANGAIVEDTSTVKSSGR